MTPFVRWKFSNFSLMEVDASWVDHEVDGRDFLRELALGSDPRRFDKGKGYGFPFDPNRGQGVIQVDLQKGLDPLAGMISGTSDLASTSRCLRWVWFGDETSFEPAPSGMVRGCFECGSTTVSSRAWRGVPSSGWVAHAPRLRSEEPLLMAARAT